MVMQEILLASLNLWKIGQMVNVSQQAVPMT
jgi:hypothetical protein